MDRKREIINATLELAAEHGLRAVSIQQIADKVGIRKASVYNHFKSREEIVDAMYSYLREQSKLSIGAASMNLELLMKDRNLKEILMSVVSLYKKMSTSPDMLLFYKIIMSERTLDRSAADIMVTETEKMIQATTILFYALQAKGYVDMKNIEMAAFSFAMGIHSIIDYECDLAQLGKKSLQYTLERYVDEFCAMYGKDITYGG